MFKTACATIALLALANPALAAGCVTAKDTAALKTAVMQQALMVAAFQCREASAYNGFVTIYRKELQSSDAVLKSFFVKRGGGEGWLTAEYGMLPRATHTRSDREAAKGKQSGRTQEIQRLIGRSLRAVFDLRALGERTIALDCDVIQADGGTRTAAITGAFVALHDALNVLVDQGRLDRVPVRDFVAAVSVGMFGGTPVLDLDYAEDSNCETDMNVVMTGAGQLVEVQGTAEGAPFSREEMVSMLDLAEAGIGQLVRLQRAALGL